MSEFIVLDVETTQHPTTRKEEIIEFAAIAVNRRFEFLSEMEYLVNPGFSLSPITKKVTGIKDLHLSGKESIEQIIPSIHSFISGKRVVAHNAHFELQVIKNAYERCKREPPQTTFIDSLKIARSLFPNEKASLTTLKQKFGIHAESHRAKADVIATIEILKRLSEIYKEKTQKDLAEDLDLFRIN